MSPTATIASVIVALLFFAWLFQSETRDPTYEAYLRRQEEIRKQEQALPKEPTNVVTTESPVARANETVIAPKAEPAAGPQKFIGIAESGFLLDTGSTDTSPAQAASYASAPPKPTLPPGFARDTRLHGTYIGAIHINEVAQVTPAGEEPSITFRRDGTFWSERMGRADVDMEPATVATGSVDRGSGRYRLGGNTLDLFFTDGLTRKKGSTRTYTVVPVTGPDNQPTEITIQGKIFKLDPTR